MTTKEEAQKALEYLTSKHYHPEDFAMAFHDVIKASLQSHIAAQPDIAEKLANQCRQNRPNNHTHGYVCGYLEGVQAMEQALAAFEKQRGGV